MTKTETTTRNAYQLARLADCAEPDSNTSPGAQFLNVVEAAVNDYARYALDDGQGIDSLTDMPAEIADSSVPVYTHEMWQTFTDLAAWNEDPTDLGADGSDMTKSAMVCLYIIAERLAGALIAEIAEEEDS